VAASAKEIMIRALEAPISAIVSNSGEHVSKVLDELKAKKGKGKEVWLGFNATANALGNLKEAGIIDPLKVTKTALMNAISVAANYLMIGAAVTEIPKKDNGPAMPAGGGMGMDY
jgi:chaperonin GroEL